MFTEDTTLKVNLSKNKTKVPVYQQQKQETKEIKEELRWDGRPAPGFAKWEYVNGDELEEDCIPGNEEDEEDETNGSGEEVNEEENEDAEESED